MAIIARFGRQDSPGPTPSGGEVIRDAVCTLDEQIGNAVYLYSTGEGLDIVRKADPTDYGKLPVCGIIIEKSSGTVCKVQWQGETPALYEDLVVGKQYFVDRDSGISLLPPAPEDDDVFVQIIGIAVTPARLFVKPDETLTKRVS